MKLKALPCRGADQVVRGRALPLEQAEIAREQAVLFGAKWGGAVGLRAKGGVPSAVKLCRKRAEAWRGCSSDVMARCFLWHGAAGLRAKGGTPSVA